MERKTAYFLLLVVTLSLVVEDTEAGWKFWKKKDKDATTTVAPDAATPSTTTTTTVAPGNRPAQGNTNTAIAGAADPGLAIGVGATGTDIRGNARPQRPNPGTEVGLDIPAPRPGRPEIGGATSGSGYRDWAVDLTGAGEPGRRTPGLPQQGPAVGGGTQPHPGSGPQTPTGTLPSPGAPTGGARPGSPVPTGNVQQPGYPGQPISQPGQPAPRPGQPGQPIPQPGQPASRPGQPGQPISQPGQPASRPGQPGQPIAQPGQPASRPGQPGQPQPVNPNSPIAGGASSDGTHVSSLNIGSLRPGSPTTPTSGNPVQNRPGSPTGERSWADIAGGGSRPGSPTPAPRQPGYPTGQTTGPIGQPPVQPNSYPQSRPGQPQPIPQGGQQPGRPSAGAIAGGVAAGAAIGAAAGNRVFSSNPTYSKGNSITDEDLEKLSEALFIKDNNNAKRHITMNLQKKTSSSSPTDEAPQPLFTVNQQAQQIPTIQRVLSIFDNYQLDTHTNEYISPAQRQEESLLVDTFLSTNVMSTAMRFLADKGHVRKDYYEYKDLLRKLWFNLFSRGDGKIGSTGFEHVFMAETKTTPTGTEVIGLHNWIYFSMEEVKRRADYLGYINKVDLGDKASIIKIHSRFTGHDKPVTTMFVGTSPELEMALYTVCFYARPDSTCPVSLGGSRFNIVTHKFRYRGNELVGTAYPEI